MKTRHRRIFMAFLMAGAMYTSQGQGDSSTQMYWIHEDVVKPGMVPQYEEICNEFTSNLKTHNIQDMSFLVTNTLDNRYLWISPISNMADIDKPMFATLSEKMGADNLKALFAKMDKCYDIEHNYVIQLDKELSYMPGGITQTPEGQNYRKFHYFRYAPSNKEAVREKGMAIKKMFEEKGSKLEYRVYQSGFGNRGEFYMVAIAAKDAADYEAKLNANNELLGEEWQKLFNDYMGTMIDYEIMEGWMRPDMAYSAK